MEISNIILGSGVMVDPTTSLNNVKLADRVKIAKYCSVFGSKEHPLEIGAGTIIAMFSIINGYSAPVVIGDNVSIAQNVNIMADSGPNASPALMRLFPIVKDGVVVGDGCWIGAGSIVMPGVHLGSFCIVAANSFLNSSFEDYSIVGGSPARLIRMLSDAEIKEIEDEQARGRPSASGRES
jgi:acetyltransferase-like isoleucine patch superfamily enzyme